MEVCLKVCLYLVWRRSMVGSDASNFQIILTMNYETYLDLPDSYKANTFSNFDYPIFPILSYFKESNAAIPKKKKKKNDTVHHSLENHLTALFIFIMSQADTCRSLICVISLLQLHSHHYILDWCCRNKWPQQNYTVNPVSIMEHHCGWPLKLCRFILAWLNLNGILSVSTEALDKDETD